VVKKTESVPRSWRKNNKYMHHEEHEATRSKKADEFQQAYLRRG